MNKNNQMILSIMATIIVGVAGFFGGMKYQESRPRTFTFGEGGGPNQFMMNGTGGGRMGGQFGNGSNRPVSGEILASDATSITVKMQDGSSKIIFLSEKTSISKSSVGNPSDLKTGERVLVIGSSNPDGSVTAQNIQLNPTERMLINRDATPAGSLVPSAR